MTRTASAHGLTSPRATDWRDQGACNGEDPDLFAPDGTTGRWALVILQAKAVCARCPVAATCLEWALDTREEYGIYGGLTEHERRSLRRAAARRNLTPEAIAKKADKARQPAKPRTMRSIFDDSTSPLQGGHLTWTGPKKVHFRGQVFTPKQFVFTLDRGYAPTGRVTAECGISACVLGVHLADDVERTCCGTKAVA